MPRWIFEDWLTLWFVFCYCGSGMRVVRLLQLTAIAALALLTVGCGRSYHIKGRVVVLPELQTATGLILEVTGKSLPLGGTPIAGAKVRMFHQLDKNDVPEPGSVWEHDAETNEDGFFDTRDYATPSKEAKVGLEVSKDGHKIVYTTYIDYSNVEPQTFFIVLVPTVPSSGTHLEKTPRTP